MRLNFDGVTRIVGRGSLLAAVLLTMSASMVGCNDNADGNPGRESISAPRDKIGEGGVGSGAPASEGAAPKAPTGKKDAARKIDI